MREGSAAWRWRADAAGCLPLTPFHFSRRRAAPSGTDGGLIACRRVSLVPALRPAFAGLRPGKMGCVLTRFCSFIPAAHPFPSPLGEGARSADEGESSCSLRDLPLTLALSHGRGKTALPEKITKLIRPPLAPPHNPPVPRHSRPGLVIRGRWEDGARPVAWNHRQTNPAWPSMGRRHKARPFVPIGFETGSVTILSKSPCARCPRRHPHSLP